MNFGKLLISGRSFIRSCGGVAYREDRRVYLPKFESPKNPFARPGTVPAAPETPRVPATSPSAAPVPPTRPAAPAKWVARLNPVAMFCNPPAATVRPVKAVQTELSLDTVKVVQNDLSDADVEVVPTKSRRAPETAGAGETAQTWGNLGARFFRTNTF
jgi:hypothetical protein